MKILIEMLMLLALFVLFVNGGIYIAIVLFGSFLILAIVAEIYFSIYPELKDK